MHTLAAVEFSEKTLVIVMAVSGCITVAVLSILINGIRDIVRAKHHEASRREIAAYVAEGTMSPDDAARLLEAGTKKKNWGCG